MIDVIGDVPTARYAHATIFVDNVMYLIGGCHIGASHPKNEMYKYYIKERKWTVFKTINIPSSRMYHKVVLYKSNFIILSFGIDMESYYSKNDLFKLDLSTGKWKEMKTFGIKPLERSCHICHIYKDYMYVVGGYQHESNTLMFTDAFVLDLICNFWIEIDVIGDKLFPTFGVPSCLVELEGKIILYGGKLDSGEKINLLYELDLQEMMFVKVYQVFIDLAIICI